MTRIQSQPGLRQSTSRLRIPSEFLPSQRQVFADRQQNPTRFLTQALASAAGSAASLAVTLSGNSEDAVRKDFETTSAKVTRLQGELSRTKTDDPRFDELASELETMDQRATRRFTGTAYEAEVAGAFERTKTQVFTTRQRSQQQAEGDALLAARGQFRRHFTEHVRDLLLNEDVMREYQEITPDFLDDAVEQDFLSAIPEDIRQTVLDDPQLLEEFYSKRDAFVSQVDRNRIQAEQRANNLLAEQAEQELQFSFASDSSVGLSDFLSQVPEGREQEYLSNLTGYLKSTLSIPTDDQEALRSQRIAATKSEQLIDYYAANGLPDLAEGLTDGLRAYYSNTSKQIAGTYAPDYEGQVTEQFIQGFEDHALRLAGGVLNLDTSGYDTVEDMRTTLGPDGPEAKMLDNLVAHRKYLDRQKESGVERSAAMQALEDGVLTPGRATPDLMMVNYAFSNPTDALGIIEGRLNSVESALPVDSPETGYLQGAREVIAQARMEAQSGEISPNTRAELSAVGAFADGRMNAEGKNFSAKSAAREMSSQIGEGNYLGIHQSLAYMRGLGEYQNEFLGSLYEQGESGMAAALAYLSRTDVSGMTAEEVEGEYQQYVAKREDLTRRIAFHDQGLKEHRQIGDYLSNKGFVKGIVDRVGSEYKGMSPEASFTLRFLAIPDQIDDLRMAGESVFDRVSQLGYGFYVDDSDVLQVIRDTPDREGNHATPVYLNVQPKDLTKAALRSTAFSTMLGTVLSDSGEAKSFREALPEYLMSRRPRAMTDNRGNTISDSEELGRLLNEALNEGMLVPRFEYHSGGVSARLAYTPATTTGTGRPYLAEPFDIPLPNFHWDRTIGPNWRQALEPIRVDTSADPRLQIGEGLSGTQAIRETRGDAPQELQTSRPLTPTEQRYKDLGVRLYE